MTVDDIWEDAEVIGGDDLKNYSFNGIKDKTAKIWRYLDLPKFLDMLQTKELHFTRIDSFHRDDPFEGSYPKSYAKEFAVRDEYEKSKPRPDGFTISPSFKDLGIDLGKDVYLNCWHLQEHESAAMWNIYSGNKGIAIQSTISSLEKSLKDNWATKIKVGEVEYINYNTHPKKGFLMPYFFKRQSFAFENELRLVVHSAEWVDGFPKFVPVERLNPFMRVAVEPNVLVEKIFVSPSSESWFKRVVNSLNKTHGLDKPVEDSAMLDRPLF